MIQTFLSDCKFQIIETKRLFQREVKSLLCRAEHTERTTCHPSGLFDHSSRARKGQQSCCFCIAHQPCLINESFLLWIDSSKHMKAQRARNSCGRSQSQSALCLFAGNTQHWAQLANSCCVTCLAAPHCLSCCGPHCAFLAPELFWRSWAGLRFSQLWQATMTGSSLAPDQPEGGRETVSFSKFWTRLPTSKTDFLFRAMPVFVGACTDFLGLRSALTHQRFSNAPTFSTTRLQQLQAHRFSSPCMQLAYGPGRPAYGSEWEGNRLNLCWLCWTNWDLADQRNALGTGGGFCISFSVTKIKFWLNIPSGPAQN